MDYVIIILISILLGIGFCLGPLHMMLVYTYCTVKLRSSKYGYLEYYDEFLEIWNTVPYYREREDGTLEHSLLECKTKEELEDYMEDLAEDITELIEDASVEERQKVHDKLAKLAEKIK
jgi:hypothetical protein